MPSLTIAINDFVEVLSANVTKIDIASIQSQIIVGTTSEYNMFSGQVTDLNIWNAALNETFVEAFIRCSDEFQQRYSKNIFSLIWDTKNWLFTIKKLASDFKLK